jgi:hypothetical protein
MITTESMRAAIRKCMLAKGRPYPQHTNRISQLDHPCERELFYQRTAWTERAPRDANFQGILETGTVLEPVIERILSTIGEESDPKFRIVGQQMPTNDAFLNRLNITGSVDGFLQLYTLPELATGNMAASRWETVSVADIKTASPFVFAQIEDYPSLMRFPWTRAYRGQLMLYALAHNLEKCTIIFVNKSNLWDIKIVNFPVDMDYCERLLLKAERINAAVETGDPPPGVNDPDVCPKCPFVAYCAPDYATGEGVEVVDDTELESVLERMDVLEDFAADYKALQSYRDLMLRKGQDVAVGRFLITWSQSSNGAWRKRITKVAQ